METVVRGHKSKYILHHSTIKTFPSSPLKMCESAQNVSCYGLVRFDWFV